MDESFVSVAPVGADEVKSYKIHVSDSYHTASPGAKPILFAPGNGDGTQMLTE